jgi:Txe/YoeB family toxin of Txe-Axe toxin-antitoxin module
MNRSKAAPDRTDNIDHCQSFNTAILEESVMKSVSPFLNGVLEKIMRLNKLVAKRDELKNELKRLEITPPELSEDNLLQISVSEHAAAIENYKNIKDRQEPVDDFISQISQAIDDLAKQIMEDHASLAKIVINAVIMHTVKARNDFAELLKMIIEKDQEYTQSVNQLFKNIEAEANKGIEQSTPIEPIEFLNRHFRERDACLIEDRDLMKEIEKTIQKMSFNPQ